MAVSVLPALTLLLGAALLAHAAPRPQDATTNNIVRDSVTEDDGESFVAGLILAVARDWDEGRQDATEFIRAVPAVTVNGTTFGPTTHPINESGPISFSAPSTR
ncbi:uncharacterized protein LOC117648412 [Thrips palmi]|uniref:Uncharacterized protein LOC117648412 n=1 Tax=Thrips palmi TaxID=161013 RepID=A0A6P8Z8X7_THRPL|nr:uncharacterized protein LOC117648412 [Thrips palmi]